jgi:hypothetical protein
LPDDETADGVHPSVHPANLSRGQGSSIQEVSGRGNRRASSTAMPRDRLLAVAHEGRRAGYPQRTAGSPIPFGQFRRFDVEGQVLACRAHHSHQSDREAESTADLINIPCSPSMNGWGTATRTSPLPRGWRRSSRGPARACRGTTSPEPSAPSPDPGRLATGADVDGAGRDAQGRRTYRLQGGGVKTQRAAVRARGDRVGRGSAAVDGHSRPETQAI